MPQSANHIAEFQEILKRYADANATAQEMELVNQYLAYQDRGASRFEGLTEGEKQAVLQPLYEGLQAAIQQPAKLRFMQRPWVRYAAAAVIILALAMGGIWISSSPKTEVKPEETAALKAPQQNRAALTLADGKVIYLDSVGTGQIATQPQASVNRTATGALVYQGSTTPSEGELNYNTLTNPRGSMVINVQLSDGSRVWLNNESSIKYPTAFTANTREVEVSGEAYFEIAQDAAHPFTVKHNNTHVAVLGTSFNINTYAEEPYERVTLLSGSVAVSNAQKRTVLKPGEQLALNASSQTLLHPDVEQVMAWKNGWFNLEGLNIKAVMQQIARWYNVDVVYAGDVSGINFVGSVARDQEAGQILRVLEKTGTVHFKREGRKIIVSK